VLHVAGVGILLPIGETAVAHSTVQLIVDVHSCLNAGVVCKHQSVARGVTVAGRKPYSRPMRQRGAWTDYLRLATKHLGSLKHSGKN
jgi:hypothetical protein